MAAQYVPFVVIVLLAVSLATTTAAAPPATAELNGLTPSEKATLFSRDTDTQVSENLSTAARSSMRELANLTDITFTRPPDTAATWTRNDFQDLEPGGPKTAIYPQHADRKHGTYLADAHATLFAVQPGTQAHIDPTTTPYYVAQTGTVRGFIDYRISIPPDTTSGNVTTRWAVIEHSIDEVQLRANGATIATVPGTHTPAIDYRLEETRETTLAIEARISIRLRRTTINRTRNGTTVTQSIHTENLRVTDATTVTPYTLDANVDTASYPGGGSGIAISQTQPWRGIDLADASARVQGIWRFYTARNTAWDTLVHASDTSRTRSASPAIPVAVHAYPSRSGPATRPRRHGPDLLDTWGLQRESPAPSLGESITVDVVQNAYLPTDGIAIKITADPRPLRVLGIVRSVNTTITPPSPETRTLRKSTLSVEILEQSRDSATLRVKLTDAKTGAPITLKENPRRSPLDQTARTGYITLADQRLRTNDTGVAIMTLTKPGSYTARYHPGSWLDHTPAYTGDTTPVRWHPLTTIQGWFAFTTRLLLEFAPLLVAAYAAHRFLTTLTTHQHQ